MTSAELLESPAVALVSCIKTLSQTSPDLQYMSFKNTVEKGEIARNEQFLLFPQCFLPFRRTFFHFHQDFSKIR